MQPLPRPPDVANLLSTPSRSTGNSPISYGTLRTHGTHRVDTMASAQQNVELSPFSTSLAPSFSDTRGSLNFLNVHSCSQNLPLIICVEVSISTKGTKGLISITGVKHLPALLAKMFQRRPQFFCTVSVEPLVIYNCFVQLKTVAPFARYLTCKYTVTLKPGLGSFKVIENYTIQSGTHDFLLTFHSSHRAI